MAYRVKAYTLREESTESGTRYFISFRTAGQIPRVGSVGTVSLWSFSLDGAQGTGIFSNGTSGTGSLTRYGTKPLQTGVALCLKSLDERMVEEERNETLYKAVGSLPEIQRRRFLLYYEYEFNFTKSPLWSIAILLGNTEILLRLQ